jgi:DNA-directed RNA polymerase specialized sigma24 family protein
METWTSAECARAWGVKTQTWLGYVNRGQAPAPLPGLDDKRHRLWDARAVRDYPRPGVGRSRAGAGPEAEALLAEMREVAEQLARLRERQRTLLVEGKEHGLELLAMSRALGISRQTAYGWLAEDG